MNRQRKCGIYKQWLEECNARKQPLCKSHLTDTTRYHSGHCLSIIVDPLLSHSPGTSVYIKEFWFVTFVPICLGLRESGFRSWCKLHPSKSIKRGSLICHMDLNMFRDVATMLLSDVGAWTILPCCCPSVCPQHS